MRIIMCKFCGNLTPARYKGYCHLCWKYFVYDGNKEFDTPKFGEIGVVTDKEDKQYGMLICHICGKAFVKLQQHIYSAHHIFKKDYCTQFGLDNKIQLTSAEYHNKMRNYAYKYKMPEQLKRVGVATRFKIGHNMKYIRSPMTMRRLRELCSNTLQKNRTHNKVKEDI